MTLAFILVAALLGLSAAYLIYLYNRFVTLRNHCHESFAGIDVQLKRRWDLIPKLAAVVKGASGFEKETLEAVTQARGQAEAARGVAQRAQAEGVLGTALAGLMARVEAYPELKAVEGYLELQKQISQVEDELQYARRYYNACVRDHNAFGQSFPALLLAPAVGFKEREYFQMDPAQRNLPEPA